MAVFYKPGEAKKRPGAYMMIANRGSWTDLDADPFGPKPDTPEPDAPTPDTPSSGYTRLADRTGVLLKTADGKYLAVKI